jgi:hypothetical protein
MCNGPIDDVITILTSVPFHHSVQYHSIYSVPSNNIEDTE